MILNITTDGNMLYIAGIKRARTYPEDEKVWVEISFYGKQRDEIWQLTGPSFILNDEGKVLDELPHGNIETWIRSRQNVKREDHQESGLIINAEITGPIDKEILNSPNKASYCNK